MQLSSKKFVRLLLVLRVHELQVGSILGVPHLGLAVAALDARAHTEVRCTILVSSLRCNYQREQTKYSSAIHNGQTDSTIGFRCRPSSSGRLGLLHLRELRCLALGILNEGVVVLAERDELGQERCNREGLLVGTVEPTWSS